MSLSVSKCSGSVEPPSVLLQLSDDDFAAQEADSSAALGPFRLLA